MPGPDGVWGEAYRRDDNGNCAMAWIGQSQAFNVLHPDEPWTFPLHGHNALQSIAAPAPAVDRWEVWDVQDAVLLAQAGPTSAGQATVTFTKEAGFVNKARACRVFAFLDESVPNWGHAAGGGFFVVTRVRDPALSLPERPTLADLEEWHDERSMVLGGYLQAPTRTPVVDIDNYASELSNALRTYDVAAEWYLPYDPARPKNMFANFPSANNGYTPLTTQRYNNIATCVAAMYAKGYRVFGGANEPVGSSVGHPGKNYLPIFSQFADAVKVGHPDAQPAGYCPVTIGYKGLVGLDDIYRTGGPGLDKREAEEVHTYNIFIGNKYLMDRAWQSFKAHRIRWGQQNLHLFVSEAGDYWSTENGLLAYERQAAFIFGDMMLCEQHGIPKADWSYFYFKYSGQPDHTPYVINNFNLPDLAMLCWIVLAEEMEGTNFETRQIVNFGEFDDPIIAGTHYSRADGTGVTWLQSFGRAGVKVPLEVSGTDSLVVSSATGNLTTVPVVNGRAEVTVGLLPVWVRKPTGATVTVLRRAYGALHADEGEPFCSAGSFGGTNIETIVRGEFVNRLWYDEDNNAGVNADCVWASGAVPSVAQPVDVGITFPTPRTMTGGRIWGPHPWQAMSYIKHATVHVRINGSWQPATRNGQPVVISKPVPPFRKHPGGWQEWETFIDQFGYDVDAHAHDVLWDAVEADAWMIRVTDTSYGGADSLEVQAPYYPEQTNVWAGMGTGFEAGRVWLQRMTAFDGDLSPIGASGSTNPEPQSSGPVRYVVRGA